MLPTLFQFFFFVVVIIAFIVVIKLFRRSNISEDWRAVALLGTLSVMALLSTMLYLNLEGGSSIQERRGEKLTAQLNEEEYQYLRKVYMPLEEAYRQLQKNIEWINEHKTLTNTMNDTFPNHEQLLTNIAQVLYNEGAEQRKLFNRVNREIRNAVIQSSTQDSNYIDKHFSERAKALTATIGKRQRNMDGMVKKIASYVVTNLNEARQILTRGSSKIGGRITEHHFSKKTEEELLVFLSKKSPDTYERMRLINQEILEAERKKEEMRSLSIKHDDLSLPLTKTMMLWQKAEASARQHWNDLLYAVEATYLAGRFKTPDRNPTYHSLSKALSKQSKRKLARIQKRRSEANKSFSSPDFVNKAR